MADSLKDQLIKAGLAKPSQVRKVEREKRTADQARQRNDKACRRGGSTAATGEQPRAPAAAANQSDPASVRARARQQQAEKVERDRALARANNEKAAIKAQRAELRQLILQNDQRSSTALDSDVPYNFVHGTRIKKLYIPAAQRNQIVSGALVIVNNDGNYHIVDRAVAERVAERDPKRLIVARGDDKEAESAPSSPDDEHYARFQVPDDLDW